MTKAKKGIFNHENHVALTLSDKVVLSVDTLLLVLLFVIFLYPLVYVVSSSVSANAYQISGLRLIPEIFSWEGYKAVFRFSRVWTGYLNSLVYMVTGTAINLCMSILAAYPLSRKDMDGRGVILGVMMFTMYFSGGMIPIYLQVRSLGMINTIWAMLIPGAMSVYNTLVMRTYFSNSIPGDLYEAAEIDGCGHMRYLLSIVLPLSMPIIAVVGMYYAVGHWNSYFDALLYLRDSEKYPLQLVLREILIINSTTTDEILNFDPDELLILEQRANLMQNSLVVVASVPMMILYPFVQKYFTRGIMLGAVKG